MFFSYLKLSYRNFQKSPVYSCINVFGFAIGLTACLLIGLYVKDELSYDQFHEHADRTYRVLREFDLPDLKTTISNTPPALAPALKEKLSAVENAVRVRQLSPVVEYGSKKFVEASFITSDPGFFDIFSFPILNGKAELSRPSTVVLTKSMAKKYFDNEIPIGKILQVGNNDMEVTGIIADVPKNSHLRFGFVASQSDPGSSWGYNNFTTYLLLRKGQSKESIVPQIANLIQANTNSQDGRTGNAFIPHLQPVTGIHLGQGVSAEIGSRGNILYVYLFIALAVFIVLLAAINFMNLSTARSVERAREVGLRKTLGASRRQVALQFLGESLTLTLFSFLLALILSDFTLPMLNDLASKSLELSSLFSAYILTAIIISVSCIGIFAGAYPALLLSSFHPSKVIKGTASVSGQGFRKGLIVFQFAISIALLICTGIVYQQLQYMKSTGLGFEADNVIVVKKANFLDSKTETFKQELASLAGVERVSSGYSVPGTFFINSMWHPDTPNADAQNLDYSFVDFGYTETLGIKIIAGRSFSREFATDSMAVILNETAVKDFGWTPEEAIDKELVQGQQRFKIVGVARDFHFQSLHSEIYSLALFGPQRSPQYVTARLSPGSIEETLGMIQNAWENFSELPFEYSFLADDLAAQYRSEERLVKVFGVFAVLAIIIGCLGLLALASLMASQRTKEIGVRKILGATVADIVGLLNKDFLKLVALGFVISAPIAWYAMTHWLADFAYKIEIGPGIFLMAGSLSLLIAFATVSWQSIQAALTNPTINLQNN